MSRVEIQLTGQSKQHRSLAAANQITRNMFTEIVRDDQGKAQTRILMRTPGLVLLAQIIGQPVRALHQTTNSSKYWVVIGNGFYEVLNNNQYTLIGNLTTQQGPVYMADNGTDIVIVDGSNDGYVYHISSGGPAGWTASLHGVAPNFVGGDDIVFAGGYFVVIQPGTNVLQQCTAPYGTPPTTWNASDVFSTALADAGPLIALEVLNDQIWALGDFSTVIFYNAGNATGFSFSILPGAPIRMGIAARNTLRMLDNSLFWLAKTRDGDRFIVRTQGYTPARISSHEVEFALGKYPRVADADSWKYLQEGHSFYIINFPSGNQSWCFDTESGEWTERSSSGGTYVAYDHVFMNGRHIVGDRTTGNLYQLSMDTFTESGKPIVSLRRCQHLKKNREPIEIAALIVDVEVGVGLAGDVQGSDPQMGMRYSRDGGRTWSNEIYDSMGKQGDTRKEMRFPIRSQAIDWVFEIFVSDPMPVNIIAGYIEV